MSPDVTGISCAWGVHAGSRVNFHTSGPGPHNQAALSPGSLQAGNSLRGHYVWPMSPNTEDFLKDKTLLRVPSGQQRISKYVLKGLLLNFVLFVSVIIDLLDLRVYQDWLPAPLSLSNLSLDYMFRFYFFN